MTNWSFCGSGQYMSLSDMLDISIIRNGHFMSTPAVLDFSTHDFMFKFNHVLKLMELIN